jgi:hypothetical protein
VCIEIVQRERERVRGLREGAWIEFLERGHIERKTIEIVCA